MASLFPKYIHQKSRNFQPEPCCRMF